MKKSNMIYTIDKRITITMDCQTAVTRQTLEDVDEFGNRTLKSSSYSKVVQPLNVVKEAV